MTLRLAFRTDPSTGPEPFTDRQPLEDVVAPDPLARFAVGAIVAVAAVKTLLVLPLLARYGWHRDELYYLAAGHHLAPGYVDFPPVVPLLSAVARHLFGSSLVGLRSFSLGAGAGVIVLTALTARELGGGRYAQLLAAVAIGFSPLILATNMAFQTVSFDQLAWAGLLFVCARLLRSGDRRLWPVIGALAGAAVMTKYTVALLLVGLAIGLLAHATGRRLLRGPGPSGPLSGKPGPSGPLSGKPGPVLGPLVAAGVCLAIVVPNLVWQVDHGWASVEFLRGPNAGGRQSSPFGGYLKDVALLAGPLGLVLAVAGLRRLARFPSWRPLAWAAAVPLVGFGVLGGKGYYGAPVFVILFAAGAVSAEQWIRGSRHSWARLVVPAVLVAGLVPALPTILPVLSRSSMAARGTWESRKDYADEIGWPELVDSVAAAWQGLNPGERAHGAVVAANYGEAGAIDLYGPDRGLPPAVSGHLTYRYWAPEQPDATVAVVVGVPAPTLERWCLSVDEVGRVSNRVGVGNEEVGRPVSVCRVRAGLVPLWRALTR